MDDEAQLLERARSNDRDALSAIYDRYAPRIYRYLYRQVGSAQLAEDLTGDVFLRMLSALKHGRYRAGAFRAWLYRIAHNRAVDHHRSRRAALIDDLSPGSDGDSADPSANAKRDARPVDDQVLSRHDMDQALAQLTQEQQQVLSLRFGEGLTARETARVMGKRVGAVEALQRRALAAMRRLMGDEQP